MLRILHEMGRPVTLLPRAASMVLAAALSLATAESLAQDPVVETSVEDIPLLNRVWKEDVQGTAAIIADGASLESADEIGRSALFLAAQRGNLELVTLLIKAGADVRKKSLPGDEPIHAALLAVNVSEEVFDALLQAGADPNAGGYYGYTPLHIATTRQDYGFMKYLVEEVEVEVNMPSDIGETPLELAILSGNDQILEYLYGIGGRLAGPDEGDKPTIHRLAERRVTELGWTVIAEIIDKETIDALDRFGASAIHIASFDGNQIAVRELVALGANPSLANERGVVPLHWAAITNKPEAIDALVAAGANLEAKDEVNATPLFYAAQFDSIDALIALLDAGARPGLRSSKGRLPIHAAAERGFAEAVRILAEGGSPLDALDDNDDTPLHIAAREGRDFAIEALLDAGADPDFQGESGETALHKTTLSNRGEGTKVLVERGADTSIVDSSGLSPLGAAWKNGHIAGFFTLLLTKFSLA